MATQVSPLIAPRPTHAPAPEPLQVSKDITTGATTYSLAGAGVFEMPGLNETDESSLPATHFATTMDALKAFASEASKVAKDATLSNYGREAKLEPLRLNALLDVARLDVALDIEERHWAKREEVLLALPAIDPSHSVAAIEAREARDWFRGLSVAEQTKILDKMQNEPGHDQMILALLRSPIPQLEHHATVAREVWNRNRRLANPTEAMAISQGRANVEWARAGAAHVAAITKRALGWDESRIARTLLKAPADSGYHGATKMFGIGQQTVTRTRMILDQEAVRQRR